MSLRELFISGMAWIRRMRRVARERDSWKLGLLRIGRGVINGSVKVRSFYCSLVSSAYSTEHLVDVYALNTHIMLILLSLRVRGTPETTRSLLSKMHDLALQLLGVIRSWYERVDFKGPGGLAYAPNSLIVNVA